MRTALEVAGTEEVVKETTAVATSVASAQCLHRRQLHRLRVRQLRIAERAYSFD